jgi:hypothetical protein
MAASAAATVTVVVQPTDVPLSTCRPVTPAVLHRVKGHGTDFMGEPFAGNRRLALIENGTVPCVEVDTMEVTRCAFWTADDPGTTRLARQASGPWMEDTEGRRWAVVGQPVTRDGSLSGGSFIVGTTPAADDSLPCIAASGNDSAGIPAPGGTDLAASCMVEVLGAESNFGGMLLQNVATLLVGTTSIPHPDNAEMVFFDAPTGIAWYTGMGAAVNDVVGQRDTTGTYFGLDWSCHLVDLGGTQVPAGKRPSTKSYPPPGRVDYRSRIRWLPVNPYVDIANGNSLDPRVGARPVARFTHSVVGSLLSLDATSTEGDISLYVWDLDWTSKKPDATSAIPMAQFPLLLQDVPPSGNVTLFVRAHDGQVVASSQRVVLRPAPVADFTWAVGINTLWVDATSSEGDIVQYAWDLKWTEQNPDAIGPSPTAEFPLLFTDVPPRTGDVILHVTARDGQTATRQHTVRFRTRNPFPPGGGVPPAN